MAVIPSRYRKDGLFRLVIEYICSRVPSSLRGTCTKFTEPNHLTTTTMEQIGSHLKVVVCYFLSVGGFGFVSVPDSKVLCFVDHRKRAPLKRENQCCAL